MIIVALTGGIASGKTTVCGMMKEKGAHILDSDLLAREAVRRGAPAYNEIVEHFGDEVLKEDGEIDRPKLAGVVFNNPEERDFLNRTTHPRIFEMMAERLRDIRAQAGHEEVVILDIPLLVEAKASGMFDLTLVVDAPPDIQLQRLLIDRGSSREEALSRIKSQVSREERIRAADLVIHNEGSISDLRREVDRVWEQIRERSGKSGDGRG